MIKVVTCDCHKGWGVHSESRRLEGNEFGAGPSAGAKQVQSMGTLLKSSVSPLNTSIVAAAMLNLDGSRT